MKLLIICSVIRPPVMRLARWADGPSMPKCIKEAEAEATAYLCCATLGLPGMEESRGYIQSWLDGEKFPEKSSRRVFAAADKILKAGTIGLQGKEPNHV
jgi:antirestriction protein ArdC